MGCNFPLWWACAILIDWAEQNLVTRRLSMRENWLLVGWACAKIGYLRADHTQKSFWHTICIFRLFPQFHSLLSYVPSHVFVSCLPSSVLRLTSLFLVSRPFYLVSRDLSAVLCPLPHVSVPCLPSSVPCLTWSVCYLISSFLCPLNPIKCPSFPFSVALFHYAYPLLFCFPSSVLVLLSSVSCLSYLRECFEFYLVR